MACAPEPVQTHLILHSADTYHSEIGRLESPVFRFAHLNPNLLRAEADSAWATARRPEQQHAPRPERFRRAAP